MDPSLPILNSGAFASADHGMRTFAQRELYEAWAFAAQGGQAVHLMDGGVAYLQKRTPNCFKGRAYIAHLFDQDRGRLIATAKRLGVNVILVERQGTSKQHIDLCGRPLERALAEAARHVNASADRLSARPLT